MARAALHPFSAAAALRVVLDRSIAARRVDDARAPPPRAAIDIFVRL